MRECDTKATRWHSMCTRPSLSPHPTRISGGKHTAPRERIAVSLKTIVAPITRQVPDPLGPGPKGALRDIFSTVFCWLLDTTVMASPECRAMNVPPVEVQAKGTEALHPKSTKRCLPLCLRPGHPLLGSCALWGTAVSGEDPVDPWNDGGELPLWRPGRSPPSRSTTSMLCTSHTVGVGGMTLFVFTFSVGSIRRERRQPYVGHLNDKFFSSRDTSYACATSDTRRPDPP